MASGSFELESYQISDHSSWQQNGERVGFRLIIADSPLLYHGYRNRLIWYFQDRTSPGQVWWHQGSNLTVYISYPYNGFGTIREVLESERPLTVSYGYSGDPILPGQGSKQLEYFSIRSGTESVGEGELNAKDSLEALTGIFPEENVPEELRQIVETDFESTADQEGE